MEIFGIKINKLNSKRFLKKLESDLKNEKKNIVFTPNPEILLKTLEDDKFKNNLNKATYLTCDGIGLYIAFQIKEGLGYKKILENKYLKKILNIIFLPYYFFNLFFRKNFLYEKYGDRICGSDLTKKIVKFAEKNNIKITILDLYSPNDKLKIKYQKNFRKNLGKIFKNLEFDYLIYNNKKKKEIFEKIKNSESKIVFSTLGMNKQEENVLEIMGYCDNIKLGLGVGSSFDYFTGFQKRSPRFISKIGFEWAYRLFSGPRKIKRAKRIYNAVVIFTIKILKNN